MRKIIGLFLALLCVVVFSIPVSPHTAVAVGESTWDGLAATSFAGGSGTETAPYLISNASELAYLASTVNSGTSYQGEYFKLSADITLNDMGEWRRWTVDVDATEAIIPNNLWTPIGASQITPFQGSFDGDLHFVQGAYMNSGELQGLFGCIGTAATVKNFGIINSLFGSGANVGSVAALNFGTVYRCYFNGKLRMECENAGGIVATNVGTLRECFNTGTLIGRAANVGGLSGVNAGMIIDCFNSGLLSGVATYCGGAVGVNAGSMITSYNSGYTRGYATASGGVAAVSDGGTFVNCYYTAGGMGAIGYDTQTNRFVFDAPGEADIISYDLRETAESYVGFDFTETPIWTMDGSTMYSFAELEWMSHPADFARGEGSPSSPYEIETYDQLCFFRDAVNAGDSFWGSHIVLKGHISSEDDLETWTPIGTSSANAFAGHFYSDYGSLGGFSIQGFYGGLFGFTSAEAVIHDISISGFTVNGNICGGIVSNNRGTVYNCTVSYSSISTGESSQSYAGGVVGRNLDTGIVHDCKNESTVQAQQGAGGIVGENAGSVSDCLSVAAVTSAVSSGGTVGADQNGTVSGCFYLDTTSAGGIAGTDVIGQSEGKTHNELIERATFYDWNYVNAWKQTENAYPWLNKTTMLSILGAQARIDSSAIRFGAKIDYSYLMMALRPGDTLEFGFYTRAVETYLNDSSSLIKTAWPTVTWTQELAETTSCQELVAKLRALGLPIFSYGDNEFVYALIGTNMENRAQMDVVFQPYVKVNETELRGNIMFNSVWKILNGVPSMSI